MSFWKRTVIAGKCKEVKSITAECISQRKKDKESKTNERSTGEDKYQETNRTAQMGTEL